MANVAVAAPNRIARERATLPTTAWVVALSGLVFLASAVLGMVATYAPAAAAPLLAGAAAGVALCWAAIALGRLDERTLARLPLIDGTGTASSALVLALCFHFAVVRPANGGPHAAALAALLPMTVMALIPRTRRPLADAALGALALLALLAGLATLWLTGEQSAIAALTSASGIALAAYWLCKSQRPRAAAWLVGLVCVAGAIALAASLLVSLPLTAHMSDRISLWREALPLIADYRYTGGGLASTEMVFASYALLTHVPYVTQVHNLYLQVALELGLPGLIALLGVMAGALVSTMQAMSRPRRRTQSASAAVLAALLATMMLGLVDAEIASGPLVALLFAPAAAAMIVRSASKVAATRTGAAGHAEIYAHAGAGSTTRWVIVALVVLASAMIVPGYAARERVQAAWIANEAAVLQAQIELRNYATAPWPFQDAIRRARAAELVPVQAKFNQALLHDPANLTAHRRLGQIALSLGDLNTAGVHLREAHLLEPGNRVAALLLGEVMALQGDAQGAAALWQSLRLEHNQLETRLNWYRGLEQIDNLARMEAAVTAYLAGQSRRLDEASAQGGAQ